MKSIMRTGYGAAVQISLYTGVPYQILPHTTLNEKLDILANVKPSNTTYPQLRYFCIGNGGHRLEVANDMVIIEPLQHVATDASLYKMMPLIVREPNNDLPPTKRAQYGLRKELVINNNVYIAYYAKRLDTSKSKVKLELVQTIDGVTTSKPFIPDNSNLNPLPRPISPNGVAILEAEHLRVTTDISIVFDASEAAELRNVANILYGNEKLGVVSEVGLVTGVDKEISINDPNHGNFKFTEIIAAQVAHMCSTYHSAVVSDQGFDIAISIGSSEPMYITTNASA
jgi:hypothetical protein